MKSLIEFLTESIFDIDATPKQVSKLETLRGCLDGYVMVKFERVLGPTHYKVSEYNKLLKKKYKGIDPITTRTGKKLNPAVLGDIIGIIAEQVKVDWNLDPKARLKKALDDFNAVAEKMRMPEIEKYVNISSFDLDSYDEGDIVDTDEYNIGANEVSYVKNAVAQIGISYGSGSRYEKVNGKWKLVDIKSFAGEMDIYIMNNCPILE